jgi:hypothetical protein
MIIKELHEMKTIVNQNNSLFWDGWDVVDRKLSPSAELSINGIRINNNWYSQKIYKLTESGWNIPKKYVVNNEK